MLMGVGTPVSVHRNLNNVMTPGTDLIYNPMPWLNSIMSFPPPLLFVENKEKLRLQKPVAGVKLVRAQKVAEDKVL